MAHSLEIPYKKHNKQPFKEGKLTEQNLTLEERWKCFGEFKEMKYVKIFLELIANDKRYAHYKEAIDICRNILQYRYEARIPYTQSDIVVVGKLVTATKNKTRFVTVTFIERIDKGPYDGWTFRQAATDFLAVENNG